MRVLRYPAHETDAVDPVQFRRYSQHKYQTKRKMRVLRYPAHETDTVDPVQFRRYSQHKYQTKRKMGVLIGLQEREVFSHVTDDTFYRLLEKVFK